MHDSDDVVESCGLGKAYIAVTKKNHCALVSTDYAVYHVVPAGIPDQGYSPFPDVRVFPGAYCHAVAQMYDERIHAVSFDGKCYGLSFRDKCPDFFHHYAFVLDYGLCHCLQGKFMLDDRKITDKYCYL